MSLFERFKEWVLKVNEEGIPVPLLRDQGKGSYTLTMFWISFNVAILALSAKVANLAGGLDYQSVLWLLTITGGFYLGKKITAGKNNTTLE